MTIGCSGIHDGEEDEYGEESEGQTSMVPMVSDV